MAEVEVRASGPDDVDAMVDLDEQSGYEVYDEYADFFHGAHGSPGVRRAFLGVFSRPGWLHTRRKRFLGQRDPSTGNLGCRTRPGAAISRVSRCAGTQNDADRAASPIRGVADGDRAAEYSGFCTVQAGVRWDGKGRPRLFMHNISEIMHAQSGHPAPGAQIGRAMRRVAGPGGALPGIAMRVDKTIGTSKYR